MTSNVDLNKSDTIWDTTDVRRWQARPTRVPYSIEQLQELESRFKDNEFCPLPERIEIANAVNLTPNQVKIWFQNRRAKIKRTVVTNHTPEWSSSNRRNGDSKPLSKIDPKPLRQQRTVFTSDQLDRLEDHFNTSKYISFSQRSELARTLNLDTLQVQVWFQNRRARNNKMLMMVEGDGKGGDLVISKETPEQIVSLISPHCYPLD